MGSLAITLPDKIIKASSEVSKKLGITRTAFIRQAVVHELENFQTKLEQEGIIKSFNAMKKSKMYLKEANKLIDEFDLPLPQEHEEWWKNKK